MHWQRNSSIESESLILVDDIRGRLAKYNQLMRIEDYLGDTAVYAGKKAFKVLK